MNINGRIIKSTGSWYEVMDEEGNRIPCRIKGKFRLDNLRTTNPLAVGDYVVFEKEPDKETGIIHKILQRKNYIIRRSPKNRLAKHIIAANMDQAFLIISLKFPKTSIGFIDRFLLTANIYEIPASIIVNKKDLHTLKEYKALSDLKNIYEKIDCKIYEVSAKKGDNMDTLKELMKGKTTLLSGQSGVGKSSLINFILPSLQLKTKEVSTYSDKGSHATAFAEMYELPFDGFIIDTPGIKEFGIIDLEAGELGWYFPEIKQLSQQCKFNNCKHLNEPECSIINAIGKGVAISRYENYVEIYNDLSKIKSWEANDRRKA